MKEVSLHIETITKQTVMKYNLFSCKLGFLIITTSRVVRELIIDLETSEQCATE